jgi:predicted acetyltransferase
VTAGVPYAAAVVSLVAVTDRERPALESLFQLYAHDWSELLPVEIGDDGRFPDRVVRPFIEHAVGHHAFLFRVDARLAGFALVVEQSRLTGAAGVCDMAEFFVMRGARRRGIGRAAACALFDRFPGRWEVRQREDNPAATAFWRRVIDGYTAGCYREFECKDAAWTGPVQTFSTASRSSGEDVVR